MTLRLLERVDEAVVIADFLRAEIASPRFGARVRARLATDGHDERMIIEADTADAAANAYRSSLLHGYRGIGGSAPLLEGLPESIEWHRASLPGGDLGAIRYMDYPYWNALSDGTRSPLVAAQRIRAGITAMDRPNDAFHAVAERLCAGDEPGMLVLVACDRASPMVILEGHTRVTAMMLRPACVPETIELYVGYSPDVREWIYYGEGSASVPDGGRAGVT